MTRDEFSRAMAPLAANYGATSLTPERNRMFWAEFQHVRPDDFRDAVVQIMRTEKFFPTIAVMREALGLHRTPSVIAEGAAALATLLGDGPRYDPHRGDYWKGEDVLERLGPQALAAFMVAGGTAAFRDRTDRNVDFLRRDFLRGWEDYAKHPTEPETFLPPGRQPHGLGALADSLPRILPAPEAP